MNAYPIRTPEPRTPLPALALAGCLLGAFTGRPADAEPTAPAPSPHFQDVMRLIRTHLEGVTEAEINDALTRGLLDHFAPRVVLRTNAPGPAPETTPWLVRTQVFDQAFACLRIGRVESGLADRFQEAWRTLSASNQIKGLVIDLRQANGTDFRAATELATLFASTEKPLLRWDDVELRSTPVSPPWTVPTVALINRQTSGAAEGLAAALREAGPVLIVGRRSAGQAYATRSFPVGDGCELRIASAPVQLGDSTPLEGGVAPDIEVDPVAEEDERTWLDDPYRVTETGPTNRPRNRVTEADLVRRRESGQNPPGVTERPQAGSGTAAERPRPPAVQDPSLARGLDLLKGLAVMTRPVSR